MASIRTARVLAVVAALPLAATLFSGVAVADNGAVADDGSNATVATDQRQRCRPRQLRQLDHHAAGGERRRRLEPEQHRQCERFRLHGHRSVQREHSGESDQSVVIRGPTGGARGS